MNTEKRLLECEVSRLSGLLEMLRSDFKEIADALGCDVKDNQAMLDKIEMLQGAEPVSQRDEFPDCWVACSERMPEVRKPVYIFHPDYGVDQCIWYDHQVGAFVWGDETRLRELKSVSHWMEMPKLPSAPREEV